MGGTVYDAQIQHCTRIWYGRAFLGFIMYLSIGIVGNTWESRVIALVFMLLFLGSVWVSGKFYVIVTVFHIVNFVFDNLWFFSSIKEFFTLKFFVVIILHFLLFLWLLFDIFCKN